jgi:hypothetical protein
MSETLKPSETVNNDKPQNISGFSQRLSLEQINKLVSERRQDLESLKPKISLKLYYAAEEKLADEKKRLEEILDWQQGKQTRLSKYTLILDTHYFEQEFLN